jgi:hypothetical protein
VPAVALVRRTVKEIVGKGHVYALPGRPSEGKSLFTHRFVDPIEADLAEILRDCKTAGFARRVPVGVEGSVLAPTFDLYLSFGNFVGIAFASRTGVRDDLVRDTRRQTFVFQQTATGHFRKARHKIRNSFGLVQFVEKNLEGSGHLSGCGVAHVDLERGV